MNPSPLSVTPIVPSRGDVDGGHDRHDLEGERAPRDGQVEVVLEEHGARVDAGQHDVVELEAGLVAALARIEDEPRGGGRGHRDRPRDRRELVAVVAVEELAEEPAQRHGHPVRRGRAHRPEGPPGGRRARSRRARGRRATSIRSARMSPPGRPGRGRGRRRYRRTKLLTRSTPPSVIDQFDRSLMSLALVAETVTSPVAASSGTTNHAVCVAGSVRNGRIVVVD